jgi:transcriptional regulator with XRE-family HTH domain
MMQTLSESPSTVGDHVRIWRQRRRLSQLDLAMDAEVSTRHLSFVETGRAQPSRDMILRLAERLEVPLRERNLMLVAGGFAPAFSERPLADPALAAARRAVDLVLAGHEPYPALAVDRHWTLVAANAAVQRLMAAADPALLAPPVNVLRLSLHPKGVAPQIANLPEWRAHLLARLRRQVEVTADARLADLLKEIEGYPSGEVRGARPVKVDAAASVVVPMQLDTPAGRLSLISTTTVFGTPLDITVSELALESFFPADEATAAALRALAGTAS